MLMASLNSGEFATLANSTGSLAALWGESLFSVCTSSILSDTPSQTRTGQRLFVEHAIHQFEYKTFVICLICSSEIDQVAGNWPILGGKWGVLLIEQSGGLEGSPKEQKLEFLPIFTSCWSYWKDQQ